MMHGSLGRNEGRQFAVLRGPKWLVVDSRPTGEVLQRNISHGLCHSKYRSLFGRGNENPEVRRALEL